MQLVASILTDPSSLVLLEPSVLARTLSYGVMNHIAIENMMNNKPSICRRKQHDESVANDSLIQIFPKPIMMGLGSDNIMIIFNVSCRATWSYRMLSARANQKQLREYPGDSVPQISSSRRYPPMHLCKPKFLPEYAFCWERTADRGRHVPSQCRLNRDEDELWHCMASSHSARRHRIEATFGALQLLRGRNHGVADVAQFCAFETFGNERIRGRHEVGVQPARQSLAVALVKLTLRAGTF